MGADVWEGRGAVTLTGAGTARGLRILHRAGYSQRLRKHVALQNEKPRNWNDPASLLFYSTLILAASTVLPKSNWQLPIVVKYSRLLAHYKNKNKKPPPHGHSTVPKALRVRVSESCFSHRIQCPISSIEAFLLMRGKGAWTSSQSYPPPPPKKKVQLHKQVHLYYQRPRLVHPTTTCPSPGTDLWECRVGGVFPLRSQC